MHRRSVLEPPKLKVDYPYYVFGTLEVMILVEIDENTAPAMLLEPPLVPLDTPKDHQKPVNLDSNGPESTKTKTKTNRKERRQR